MSQTTKINGVNRELICGMSMVNGVKKHIYEGRTRVNGVGYKILFGKPLGKYEVGESVYTYLDGTLTEFMVVHHGNPDSSMYVGCDNGTWLMQKEIAYQMPIHNKNGVAYNNSDLHSFLNSTYIRRFDSDIQSILTEVKIPYAIVPRDKWIEQATIYKGSSGLSAKAFIPSAFELGFYNDGNHGAEIPVDAAPLDYFDRTSIDGAVLATRRIAKYKGVKSGWRTRTQWVNDDYGYEGYRFLEVDTDGSARGGGTINDSGVRPCIVLPSDTRTDRNTSIITP